MYKNIIATGAIVLASSAAYAQSMPQGFYLEGEVGASYLWANGGDATTADVDFTVGYSAADSGVPWGAELSVNYFYLENFANLDPAITGVLYYDFSFGRLSVGIPNSVVEDYVATRIFKGRDILFLGEIGLLSSGYVSVLNKGFIVNSSKYGARFDGDMGPLNYGLSYHNYNNGQLSVVSGAMSYEMSNYTFGVGLENLMSGGDSQMVYYASAKGEWGNFGASLQLTGGELIGNETIIAVDADYDLTQSLNVNASYTTFTGTNVDVWALGTEYSFYDGMYVGAGLAGAAGTSEIIYNINAGWRFNYN